MITKCWYDTKISTVGAFRTDLTLPLLTKPTTLFESDVSVLFSDKWISTLSNLGYEFNRVMLFFKPAHYKNSHAHIDMFTETSVAEAAFNFTILGASGEMCWYELPDDYMKKVMWTTAHTPYIAYDVTTLKLVEKTTIPKKILRLVHTGIPHSINVFSESRWCISLRGKNPISSWDSAISYTRNKGLLNES